MSLKSLAEMRKTGHVPHAVWVLIGRLPRWLPDGPSIVAIDTCQDPLSIDFRPLVGLHVDVFEISYNEVFCERIERAIDAAKPRSTALATRHGISGLDEDHAIVLRKVWELLCN